jgi:hypothetical protein
LSEDDPDATFKDGTILIQYDPQQSMSDNNQKNALVRIYVNRVVLDDITWQPLPNQVPQAAKRDGLCTDGQQPPTPTAFSTSSVPVQRSSAISSSLSSGDPAESTPSTPTTTSQGIMTITPAPVSMSYGLVFGEDCIEETTVTTDPRVLYSYCVSYSVTYSSITSWPATSSASPPGSGFGLLPCQSLSLSGISTTCVLNTVSIDSLLGSFESGASSIFDSFDSAISSEVSAAEGPELTSG